jgi:hypothetical protein
LLSRMKRRDILSDPAEFFARGRRTPVSPVGNRGFRHGALWRRNSKISYKYMLLDGVADHR